MRGASRKSPQLGFTLIELLTALGIFLLICGAAFTLLGASQQHAQTESQVLTSFQEARLGLDQIVRDVNSAGYPPATFFDSTNPPASASTPFAWSAGYPAPCTIGGSCSTSPGDFDLIVETNSQDPGNPVQWIRYQLNGTTLLRGVAQKTIGNDPAVDSATFFAPFVQNVVNKDTPAQIAIYRAAYPTMFPGGNPVPLFNYTCDTGGVPVACTGNTPANIRDVIVTLIVKAPTPDATTGRIRLVQLIGRGRRVNPNQ
jgi:prepilin-type N-terminal cleavage/methylation domain-containing protein